MAVHVHICVDCRYRTSLGLDAETTRVLTEDLSTALFYEQALAQGADAKEAAKWLTGRWAGRQAGRGRRRRLTGLCLSACRVCVQATSRGI